MMAKIAILLLVVIAVIAWVGKWRERLFPRETREKRVQRAHPCPRCGTFVAEGHRCGCDGDRDTRG